MVKNYDFGDGVEEPKVKPPKKKKKATVKPKDNYHVKKKAAVKATDVNSFLESKSFWSY